MKFNKKIFLVFLLLILIIPQAVSAGYDVNPLDANDDLRIDSLYQDIDDSICEDSIDDSLDSSYYEEDNSNSDRNNENISENNPYLVSENVDDRLSSDDELSDDGSNSFDLESDRDSVLSSMGLESVNDVLVGSDSNAYNIFIISDTSGNNLFDTVACEILDDPNFSNVQINIRSGNQINAMSEEEIYDLLLSCDAFIGQWISSNVDAVITSILGKDPSLSDKRIFLLLEAPTGNVNSGSTSLNLIRNCTINHEKIFASFSSV